MPRRRSRSPTKSKSILYKGKVQNDSPAVFPRTYTKSTSPKRRNILSRTLQNDHILPDGSYLDSSTKSVLIFEFPDKPPDSSPFLPRSTLSTFSPNKRSRSPHHQIPFSTQKFDRILEEQHQFSSPPRQKSNQVTIYNESSPYPYPPQQNLTLTGTNGSQSFTRDVLRTPDARTRQNDRFSHHRQRDQTSLQPKNQVLSDSLMELTPFLTEEGVIRHKHNSTTRDRHSPLAVSPKQDYNQNTPHSALHHPSSTQSRPFDPSAFQLPQDTQRSVDGDLRVRRVTVSTPSVPLAVSDARPSESSLSHQQLSSERAKHDELINPIRSIPKSSRVLQSIETRREISESSRYQPDEVSITSHHQPSPLDPLETPFQSNPQSQQLSHRSYSDPLSIAPISTRRTLTSSNIHNATRQSRIVRSPPQLADGSNVSMAPSQDITVSTTQRSLEAQHPLKLTDLDVDQNQSSDQPEMHNVKTPPIASKDPSPQTPPQKNDFVLASITETVKRLIMSSTTHFSEKEEYGTRDDQTQSQKVSADQSVRTDVNDSEFRDQHHSNDPSQREDFRQDSHHSFSLTNHPQSLPKPAFSSTSQITSTPLSPRSLPPHPKPLSISSYSQTVPPLQLHTLTSPSDLNFSHSNLTSIQQASTHHTQFPPTISDEYGRMGGTDEANRRYLHSEDGSGIDQEIHSRHLTDQSTVSHSLPTDAGHSHNQQDMNRQQKYLIPEPQARSNSTRSCPGSNSSDRSSSPVDDSIPATATQPAHPLIPPLRLPPSPSADVDTSVFHSQQQTYTSSGVNRSSSSYYNPPPSKSLPITSDYQPTLVFTSQPHQQQFPAHSHPIKPPPSPSSLLSSGKPSKRSQNGEKEDFAHV